MRPLLAGDGYAAAIVARLAELKRLGLRFELAWEYALADHPPRCFWHPTQAALTDETPLMFLREECRRTWHGEGRPVKDLRELAERDGGTPRYRKKASGMHQAMGVIE